MNEQSGMMGQYPTTPANSYTMIIHVQKAVLSIGVKSFKVVHIHAYVYTV